MPIKITKASDPIEIKNLIFVIYGQPGTGKSSLAFSSARPFLLDFDLGAHRTIGRKDSVQIQKWDDIANLTESDIQDYDTVVIDTAGRALECITADLIKKNPKLARSTGELQLAGYGALGNAFKAWVNKIKSYGKDIVIICHDKEDKEGDRLYVRPDAMGSSRNELIKIADFMGYIYMENRNRMLDFNPTDRHLGKNSASIEEVSIPNLKEEPKFFESLVQSIKELMNKKSVEQLKAEQEFEVGTELINSCETAEAFTELTIHSLIQNNVVLKQVLLKKAFDAGFVFNKKDKKFESPVAAPKVELKSDNLV